MDHFHFIRSLHWRYLVAVVIACAALATAEAAKAAASSGNSAIDASVHTIQLVGHETQHKLVSQGGFGDEEIFSGNLDNASGSVSQVGIFAGTLTTVGSAPPLYLATVDLQLQNGQITVQGFLDSTKSPVVHAVTGGTGIYRRARGEFSFTEPSSGVLDITVTLLGR